MTVMMFDMLKQLITGAVPSSEIAGPIGMVTMVSETTNYGISYFGYLIALMSLNLAILNLCLYLHWTEAVFSLFSSE